MSTTDPVADRQHREDDRLGSPAALFGVAVGLVLIGAGAALLAWALFGLAQVDMRASRAPLDDGGDPQVAIAGMVLGLPLLIFGFFLHLGASRRFTGRLLSAPGVGPGTVLFAGLAAGSWRGLFTLTSPGASPLVPAGLSILTALFWRSVRSPGSTAADERSCSASS